MRKLIFQMALSLDGFYEGPKGELDWHLVDEEFYADVYELFESLDGEIMGRKIYENMAAYWPTETALREDPVTAKWMNSMRKYVVSRTLKTVSWENSSLLEGDAEEAITRLKAQPGKDLGIGGSELVASLRNPKLVDEYRFLIVPVVLGAGKPIFQGIRQRLNLKLISTKTYKSGMTGLYYRPAD
jgi:dihydrofolate reductase